LRWRSGFGRGAVAATAGSLAGGKLCNCAVITGGSWLSRVGTPATPPTHPMVTTWSRADTISNAIQRLEAGARSTRGSAAAIGMTLV
jgi:hypothetical protein